MKFILGKKIGMTHIFNEKGEQVPVTLVFSDGCVVSQVKNKEKDKYTAVQVAFEKVKEKNVPKPVLGHLKSKKIEGAFRYLREFRVPENEVQNFKEGSVITVDVFKPGDIVKVSGISKGKMFQGGVKRWGFSGRSETHGVKHEHRTIGSVGTQGLGKVLKGKRMPGRTGGVRVTQRNLEVVLVDKENNILGIKGSVPGRKDTLLKIESIDNK
ncbi:50S ribosomal protein L3 [bacterium HR34]|nr:50S ribosomal protein L3 [bacterium HR34]